MKKEDKEFEEIYMDIQRKYQDKIAKWEKDTKLSKILYAALVGFLLIVVVVLFLTPFKDLLAANKGTFYATIIAIVLIAIVIIAVASSLRSRCKKEYKNTVLTELINRTNNKFTFSSKCADNGVGIKSAYEAADLDELARMGLGQIFAGVRRSVEIGTKNYIEGRVTDSISVRMAEVDVDEIKKVRSMQDGKPTENTQRTSIFDGFFAHISIPTAAPAEFSVFTRDYVSRNNSEVAVTKKEGRRVTISQVEGWGGLDVYSEQPEKVEAYVTEEMGKIIRNMDKQSSIRTDIAIRGNDVFVRMHKYAFLEPVLGNENATKEKLKACYDILKFVEEFAIEVDNANKNKK